MAHAVNRDTPAVPLANSWPATDEARATSNAATLERVKQAWAPRPESTPPPTDPPAPADSVALWFEKGNTQPLSVHVTPNDSETPSLVLSFDRPMTDAAGPTSSAPPHFDPELSGTWTWFDQTTLRFDPTEPPPSRSFRLILPPSLSAQDGARLKAPLRFVWLPTRFALVSIEPRLEDPYEVSGISIAFTSGVDARSAKRYISAMVDDAPRPHKLRFEGAVVSLDFAHPVQAGSRIDVNVGRELLSSHSLALSTNKRFHMTVEDKVGLYCTRLSEGPGESALPRHLGAADSPERGRCDPDAGLHIVLPSPSNHSSAEEFLRIEPAVDNVSLPCALKSTYGCGDTLKADFQPGVAYKVTLKAHDTDGKPLLGPDDEAPTLAGRFVFGPPAGLKWVSGRIVRSSDVDAMVPLLPGNMTRVTTRSRPLNPEQLFALRFGEPIDRFSRWEHPRTNAPSTARHADADRGLPAFGNTLIYSSKSAKFTKHSVRELVGSGVLGVYEIEISHDVEGQRTQERRWLNITDLAVSTLAHGNQLQVRVETKAGTPALASRVTVQSINERTAPLHAETNDSGIASFELAALDFLRYLVIVEQGADWTYQEIDTHAANGVSGALVLDGEIYRSGETMNIYGLIEKMQTEGLRPVAGQKYTVSLSPSDGGSAFWEQATVTSKSGRFQLAVAIDASLSPGHYMVRLTDHAGTEIADRGFQITAELDSAFDVSAAYDRDEVVAGEPLHCTVTGRDSNGRAMSGAAASLDFEVSSRAERTTGQTRAGGPYRIAEVDFESKSSHVDGHLDHAGRFTAAPPQVNTARLAAQAIKCNATVTDAHDQRQSANAKAFVLPHWSIATERRKNLVAGTALRDKLLLLDPKGETAKLEAGLNAELRAQLVHDADSGTPWVQKLPLTRFAIEQNPTPFTLKLPKLGRAGRLEVEIEVAAGPTPVAAGKVSWQVMPDAVRAGDDARLQIGPAGPKFHAPTPPRTAAETLTFRPSQSPAPAGESTEVVILAPGVHEGRGLLHYVGDRVIGAQSFRVEDGRANVLFKVTDAMAPGVTLWARVASVDGTRTGNEFIAVTSKANELDVELQLEASPVIAGGATWFTLTTRSASKPVSAEVWLYAIDELGREAAADPLRFMALGQVTDFATNDTAYERVDWDVLADETRSSESKPLAEWASLRSSANWNGQSAVSAGTFVTDEHGQARVKLNLPRVAGRYRVIAVASTKEGRIGHAEKVMRVAPSLVAKATVPAKVWVGDSAIAKLALGSEAPRQVLLATHVQWLNGDRVTEERIEVVQLDPGQSQDFDFPWLVDGAGSRTLRAWVAAYDAKALRSAHPLEPDADAIKAWATGRGPAPVLELRALSSSGVARVPQHEQRTSATGTLAPQQRPLTTAASSGQDTPELEVRFADTALGTLGPAIDSLLQVPHSSTESLSGEILARTAFASLNRRIGPRLSSERSSTAQNATLSRPLASLVRALLINQKENGGFGQWRGSFTEPEPSALAALALSAAKQANVPVPNEALNLLRRYLRQQAAVGLGLEEPTPRQQVGPELAPHRLAPARTAFLLYAHDRTLTPGAASAFSAELRRSIVSSAGPMSKSLLTPVDDLASPFASPTHAAAYALLDTAEHAPRARRLSALADALLEQRIQGSWRTSTETVWALLALEVYARARGDGLTPSFALSTPKYFAATRTATRPGFESPTHGRGLQLEVKLQSATEFPPGVDLTVGAYSTFKVTLTSATARRFVVIDVALPAGVRVARVSSEGASSTLNLNHEEVSSDRLRLFIDELPAGKSTHSFDVVGVFAGRFQQPPAEAYELREPSVRASTAARWLSIAPIETPTRLKDEDPNYEPIEYDGDCGD